MIKKIHTQKNTLKNKIFKIRTQPDFIVSFYFFFFN